MLAALRETDRAMILEWDVRLTPRHDVTVDAIVRVAVVPGAEGTPRTLRWLLRDVTARTEAERNRSDERFRTLVQHASDIIAALGARGALRSISPAVARVLGYRPVDVTGTAVLTWLHPTDAALARAAFLKDLAQPHGPFCHAGGVSRAPPGRAVTTVLDTGHFAPLLRARARQAPGGADQQASPGRR
jgi:PAS domain-containing protein